MIDIPDLNGNYAATENGIYSKRYLKIIKIYSGPKGLYFLIYKNNRNIRYYLKDLPTKILDTYPVLS